MDALTAEIFFGTYADGLWTISPKLDLLLALTFLLIVPVIRLL